MDFLNNVDNKICGYDLRIDPNVQKMCEVSNKSSTNTRWTFYVLLIISLVSIIAVINTFKNFNWTNERIDKAFNEYNYYSQTKECENEKNKAFIELEKNIKNRYENIGLIEIPFIGNSFDVNNLSFITGLAIILGLITTYFTASREKKNLRFALDAITKRYPNPNEYPSEQVLILDVVPEIIENKFKNTSDFKLTESNLSNIEEFNLTRRRYHYNFLNMNEVFSVPPDVIKDKNTKKNKIKKLLIEKIIENYLLYIPFIVYLIIILNDVNSIGIAEIISSSHMNIQFGIAFFLLAIISYLCLQCNNQKLLTQSYFIRFVNNEFKYVYDESEEIKLHSVSLKFKLLSKTRTITINFIFYPFIFIAIFIYKTIIYLYKYMIYLLKKLNLYKKK